MDVLIYFWDSNFSLNLFLKRLKNIYCRIPILIQFNNSRNVG